MEKKCEPYKELMKKTLLIDEIKLVKKEVTKF